MHKPRKPPRHLPSIGQSEWFRVIRLFEERGSLGTLSYTVLELYCELYARYQDLSGKVNTAGTVVVRKTGSGDNQKTELEQSAIMRELTETRGQLLKVMERLSLEDL